MSKLTQRRAVICRVRFLFPLCLLVATPLGAVDYVRDVLPLMSRFGCNGSACHGKAEGQNGFKISIFGADPAADHEAITRQSRGRRIMLTAPEHSLLLRKAAGEVPHAGGSRMKTGSREYTILRDWVAQGAPFATEGRAEIASLTVEPVERVMTFGQKQPLRVKAVLSDGTEQDVTWLTQFQSNDSAIAEVSERGEVTTGSAVGQAAVMARYLGRIAIFHAIVPRPGEAVAARAETFNELDEHVQAKLRKMNLQASAVADDATFLRRVTLDLIGRLPTMNEARAFLQSMAQDKRARLVDALIEMPEFADFWALKWADLLRVDRLVLDHHAAHDYHSWIRAAGGSRRHEFQVGGDGERAGCTEKRRLGDGDREGRRL